MRESKRPWALWGFPTLVGTSVCLGRAVQEQEVEITGGATRGRCKHPDALLFGVHQGALQALRRSSVWCPLGGAAIIRTLFCLVSTRGRITAYFLHLKANRNGEDDDADVKCAC